MGEWGLEVTSLLFAGDDVLLASSTMSVKRMRLSTSMVSSCKRKDFSFKVRREIPDVSGDIKRSFEILLLLH